MNEVNPCIVSYNQNGICIGCLSYDRKMFKSKEINDCLQFLGNINIPPTMTMAVCWECNAMVKNICNFQKKITTSFYTLNNYSKMNSFLTSDDLNKLSQSNLKTVNENFIENEVPLMNVSKFDSAIDIADLDIVKNETVEMKYNEDLFADDTRVDSSSEDDVALSSIKTEKEKCEQEDKEKTRKHERKKEKIKKKNFVITTVEENEALSIRESDKMSKKFKSSKIKCAQCVLIFSKRKNLDLHMVNKHQMTPTSQIYCDICNTYHQTDKSLDRHRRLHLDIYSCTKCSYKTSCKYLVGVHYKEHEEKVNLCGLCGESFVSQSKLQYHSTVCRKQKPQCDCCGKIFANKITLKAHLKLDEPQKLEITCTGCNKIFYSKKSYRSHAVIHQGNLFPCPICGKLFQWKRNLARHLRNHKDKEAGELHECKQCRKRFSSRDSYKNHMRFSKIHIAEESKTYVCDYCNRRFSAKYVMIDHIDWDHLNKIKYECNICMKPFKTAKIKLAHMKNVHLRQNIVEGSHLCEICGKSYKTVKNLNAHVSAMHLHRSSTKKFKCPLCPATFIWQTSIYKHIKMMHRVKKVKKGSSAYFESMDAVAVVY